MALPNSTFSQLNRTLAAAFSGDVLRVLPDYDIYERTGYPRNIPVQSPDVAKQITADLRDGNRLLRMVETLIDIDRNGYTGRRYEVKGLDRVIAEIEDAGYYYDDDTELFMEGENNRTPGWGYLQPGVNYDFSFLKIDIVKNSQIVRKYSRQLVARTYNDVKKLTREIVEGRNGRL